MADEETNDAKNQYQITLKNIRGEEIKDVLMCACIKSPFYKKASFWMLKVNLASILAQQIMNEISTKTIKQFRLWIYEIKYDEKTNEVLPLQLVHHRQYKCIHAVNSSGGYKINMEDQNAELIITLVDYVFFDLFTKRTFNRKFKNMTAFDVITEEYEKKFLVDKYNDTVFNFNHVGLNENKNDHTYEEILLAADNDLRVTDFLLYNKKAMNTPSFYFFDDFYLSKKQSVDNKTPITCHFINLNDNRLLEEFDITRFHDTKHATTLIKEIPINDDFYKLIQGQDSIVIRRNTMIADINDNSTPMFYPNIDDIDESNYKVNDERQADISSVKYESLKHENRGLNTNTDYEKRQKHILLYSQDTSDLTKERLKNYRLFIEAKAKQFVITQTQDCFCEWLQFGRAYNFNIIDKEKERYLYTPIAIQNVFYKDENDQTTKHIAKALMLEYYSNYDEFCSDCQYYGDKYCMLHVIAKEPESWCYDYYPMGL